MSSTRNVKSPGVFASAANTAIPPVPIAGVSYRDPVSGAAAVADGWPFAERVNSAEFNELMYRWTALLDILDRQGLLGYTNLVDYAVNAVVMGSDGLQYQAVLANGPATSLQDPVTASAYWRVMATPKAAAKAWVTFNGITGTITSAYNVSSVTRTASGVYTLNFPAGVLADANYVWTGSTGGYQTAGAVFGDNYLCGSGADGAAGGAVVPPIKTTTQLRVISYEKNEAVAGGTQPSDVPLAHVVIFGN